MNNAISGDHVRWFVTWCQLPNPLSDLREVQQNVFSHKVDSLECASCNDSWLMTNVMHKFFSMYLFLFITLYMFRAHRANHQERQIVSIQPLVTVILCWWPRCVQVGRILTCTHLGHQHRMTVTRG